MTSNKSMKSLIVSRGRNAIRDIVAHREDTMGGYEFCHDVLKI